MPTSRKAYSVENGKCSRSLPQALGPCGDEEWRLEEAEVSSSYAPFPGRLAVPAHSHGSLYATGGPPPVPWAHFDVLPGTLYPAVVLLSPI